MNSKPLCIANAALFVLLLFCALLLVLFRCSKRFDIIFYWYFVFGKPTCSAFKVVNVSRMSYRIAHYQMEAWYHLFIMTYDKFRKHTTTQNTEFEWTTIPLMIQNILSMRVLIAIIFDVALLFTHPNNMEPCVRLFSTTLCCPSIYSLIQFPCLSSMVFFQTKKFF